MNDPYRPVRDAPPASAPFSLDPSSRPTRPQPPAFPSSSTDSEKFNPSPALSSIDDAQAPILTPGVRFHRDLPTPPPQPGAVPASGSSGAVAASSGEEVRRKKSMVRPDRAPVDPSHRLFNYRNHAMAMELDERGLTGLSSTGAHALDGSAARDYVVADDAPEDRGRPPPPPHPGLAALGGRPMGGAVPMPSPGLGGAARPGLRRGKSVLARHPGEADETGLSILKRGETLRRAASHRGQRRKQSVQLSDNPTGKGNKKSFSPWWFYCRLITVIIPSWFLRCCGIKTAERERAWREKVGMLVIITFLMTTVAFQTFGLTASLCGKPALSYKRGSVEKGMMIFHGQAYDLDSFKHVAAPGIAAGDNPLYDMWNASANDGSFMFQKVNQNCKGIITAAARTGIDTDAQGNLGWYFPCNMYNQFGSSAVNKTGYADGTLCHNKKSARTQFRSLKLLGDVTYDWDDLKNSSRNLAIFDGNVLDLNLLNWLDKSQVTYPAIFDQLKLLNSDFSRQDLTMSLVRAGGRDLGECLVDVIKVGRIDTESFGCLFSTVILYISLTVILSVVVIKWAMAVSFAWFFSWRLGNFGNETPEQQAQRRNEIEHWTEDIYRPAPARYRPNATKQARKSVLPTKSRFTPAGAKGSAASSGASLRPPSMYNDFRKGSPNSSAVAKTPSPLGMKYSPPGSPRSRIMSSSSQTLVYPQNGYAHSRSSSSSCGDGVMGPCPFPLYNIIPQPSSDYEPFNFPLVHTMLLVTAYSESVEGLRTTLDSLATTDYPNSHKVILVIADGMVKGSGNDLTTPEICLGMMKELVVPADECEALPYVAIADGHKQYNRAKVYAGFYCYDDNTVESNKQQRVPMVLVAKVGNPMEADESKPGNRGKRDSQVLLMSFLQKIMFDERMTAFEYEFFNSLWRCTGISPDRYEVTLMVDADTKVFPDSVSRMVCCMVRDPEIMGLCGETKIANKSDSWVTKIQVFEYYISHHQTKAFESMFGGVTCLPGCFSMYRIKSPKGGDGYWVPILANPDIVQHYSENIVDTLHAKNLLLLGEDRFLTTLMLKTFPKRKMMFCPQAVCKTIVPDVFRVLLSQRRRWINSTIHNLFELLFVHDLCGTFCFSMQFIIGMELVGTLVLPAAIAFTIYILVITVIPGGAKPITSLVLLALILGLPGILIVITSRKWVYVWWMAVYLLSLPIWNFILPMYAYLHMDDFTWGATRQVAGGKEKAHGGREGEFDSSNIVMKRWVDFERERRWKSGTRSRDSAYDGQSSSSPHRPPSRRYSLNSSVETWGAGGGSAAASDPFSNRHTIVSDSESGRLQAPFRSREHVQELSLPQPLAREGSPATNQPSSSSLLLSTGQQQLYFSREENYGPPNSAELWGDYSEGRGLQQDSPSSPQYGAQHTTSPVKVSNISPMYTVTPLSPQIRDPATRAPSERPDMPRSTSHGRQSRGISLMDGGAVPDSSGAMKQVDRPRRQSQGAPQSGTSRRQSVVVSGSSGRGGASSSRTSQYSRPQSSATQSYEDSDLNLNQPSSTTLGNVSTGSTLGLFPPTLPSGGHNSNSRHGFLPPGAAPPSFRK